MSPSARTQETGKWGWEAQTDPVGNNAVTAAKDASGGSAGGETGQRVHPVIRETRERKTPLRAAEGKENKDPVKTVDEVQGQKER